jgi:calcineurin-like phosphoesterase family protein
MNYFTADWHIFDEEIISFCKRPHKGVDHAIKRIVGDANMRAKKEDNLYHIGDFAVKSVGKHPRDILPLVDSNLILVEGNHDANNGVKAHAQFMIINIGQYRALLSHYPTFNSVNEVFAKLDWDFLRRNSGKMVDFVLCGHVHDSWHWAKCNVSGLVNINVGLDVNNYRPINVQEVLNIWKSALQSDKQRDNVL